MQELELKMEGGLMRKGGGRHRGILRYILSYGYVLLLHLCILNRLDGRVFSMLLMRDMKKLLSICFTLMQTLKCRTR